MEMVWEEVRVPDAAVAAGEETAEADLGPEDTVCAQNAVLKFLIQEALSVLTLDVPSVENPWCGKSY